MGKEIWVLCAVVWMTVGFAGCGECVKEDGAGKVQTSEIETDQENGLIPESDPEEVEEPTEEAAAGDEGQELTFGDNGSMEIYAGGDSILLSDNMIVGQVTLEEILRGKPFLYDRFKTDGFVFEWILFDDEDDDTIFFVDGVLIISKEDNMENTQVIPVQVPYGSPVSLENKFEYMDVNFDDVPDLLVCTGHHGNQGLITYCCFLQTDTGFVEEPTFTDIANPSVDTENQLILSQWRNWAASHSWAEYKYQDNVYVLYRELCEEAEIPEKGQDADEDIWVWTVNGEEIGRSDKLSRAEIEDLLYNENSEWRLEDDRWRTIYNNGLMRDYSIYGEP